MAQTAAGLLAGILLGIALRPLVDAYVLHRWLRHLRDTEHVANAPSDWRMEDLEADSESIMRYDDRKSARG